MSNVEIDLHYTPNPTIQENYGVTIHNHYVRTTVTSRPSVVRRWVSKILHHHRYRHRAGKLVVGLGVQWNPNRTTITPDTLQLCVGHQCLVFQLRYSDSSPAVLHRLLSDDDVTVVGIWNLMDGRLLRQSEHGIRIGRLVDLRYVANDMLGLDVNASMGRLAERVLGLEGLGKDEWVGRSEWDKEWLSEEQVEYACVDAFVACWVGKSLKIWNWGVDDDDDEDEEEEEY